MSELDKARFWAFGWTQAFFAHDLYAPRQWRGMIWAQHRHEMACRAEGAQWAVDQTLEGVEVIASPATLRDENEKRRIKQADHSETRKRKHPGREAKSEGGAA